MSCRKCNKKKDKDEMDRYARDVNYCFLPSGVMIVGIGIVATIYGIYQLCIKYGWISKVGG